MSGAIGVILMVGMAYLLTVADKLHAQQSALPEEAVQKWKEFERFSQTIQGKKSMTFSSSAILESKPQHSSDSYMDFPTNGERSEKSVNSS